MSDFLVKSLRVTVNNWIPGFMIFDNMAVAMKVEGSDLVFLVLDVFVATDGAKIGRGVLTNPDSPPC